MTPGYTSDSCVLSALHTGSLKNHTLHTCTSRERTVVPVVVDAADLPDALTLVVVHAQLRALVSSGDRGRA
jgi:hypothetical protein